MCCVPLAGRCDWLDKKNTIFGKVVGETVFNLARMNEIDVGCTAAMYCLPSSVPNLQLCRHTPSTAEAGCSSLALVPCTCAHTITHPLRPPLPAPDLYRARTACTAYCTACTASCTTCTAAAAVPQTDPETDRPYDPPRITGAEVLWPPFDDIVPRVDPAALKAAKEEEEAR